MKKWLMNIPIVLGVLLFFLGAGYFYKTTIAKDNQLGQAQARALADYKQNHNKLVNRKITKYVDPFANEKKAVASNGDVTKGSLGAPVAVLSIPRIKLVIPVYLGTSEAILSTGAGILPYEDLPEGKNNTHAVITSHRGLSNTKLFTKLPELKIGDKFYLKVNGKTYAYQVDQEKAPEATKLARQLGKYFNHDKQLSYVTLMTCTPLNVNTNRLLVRAHRVAYHKEAIVAGSLSMIGRLMIIGLMMIAVVIIAIGLRYYVTKLRKESAII